MGRGAFRPQACVDCCFLVTGVLCLVHPHKARLSTEVKDQTTKDTAHFLCPGDGLMARGRAPSWKCVCCRRLMSPWGQAAWGVLVSV